MKNYTKISIAIFSILALIAVLFFIGYLLLSPKKVFKQNYDNRVEIYNKLANANLYTGNKITAKQVISFASSVDSEKDNCEHQAYIFINLQSDDSSTVFAEIISQKNSDSLGLKIVPFSQNEFFLYYFPAIFNSKNGARIIGKILNGSLDYKISEAYKINPSRDNSAEFYLNNNVAQDYFGNVSVGYICFDGEKYISGTLFKSDWYKKCRKSLPVENYRNIAVTADAV
jgi:hypothetical protein